MQFLMFSDIFGKGGVEFLNFFLFQPHMIPHCTSFIHIHYPIWSVVGAIHGSFLQRESFWMANQVTSGLNSVPVKGSLSKALKRPRMPEGYGDLLHVNFAVFMSNGSRKKKKRINNFYF